MQRQVGAREYLTSFSPAFYRKEHVIRDMERRVGQGFLGVENEKLLRSKTVEYFRKFRVEKIDGQRVILNKDALLVFSALYEIIEKFSNEKPLMLYIMTTIDGILFGIFIIMKDKSVNDFLR